MVKTMKQTNENPDMNEMQMDGLEDYWMNGSADSFNHYQTEQLPVSKLTTKLRQMVRGRLLTFFGHAVDMGSMIGFVLIIVIGDSLVRVVWMSAEAIMKSTQSFIALLPPGGL